MTTEELKITVISASYGHKLTQIVDVDINERIITDKIYLGCNDSLCNYHEITDEQAEVYNKEKAGINF